MNHIWHFFKFAGGFFLILALSLSAIALAERLAA